MTAFSSFAFSVGALWCGLVVMAAWQFRTSSAPLALKIILPIALVGAAIYSPFAFRSQLGRPIPTTFAEMPERVDILAFKSVGEAYVDIWVFENGATRAYEITQDKRTKESLRAAEGELGRGRPVILSKARRAPSVTNLTDKDNPGFVLDPSLQPSLPKK